MEEPTMPMAAASEESAPAMMDQHSIAEVGVNDASNISGTNHPLQAGVAGTGDESITEELVERAKDELIRSLDEERNYLRREMQLIVTRDKLKKKIQAAEMQETLKKLSAQSEQLETIRRSIM
jgi:3-oxoacyl-ACP reductase-like protein